MHRWQFTSIIPLITLFSFSAIAQENNDSGDENTKDTETVSLQSFLNKPPSNDLEGCGGDNGWIQSKGDLHCINEFQGPFGFTKNAVLTIKDEKIVSVMSTLDFGDLESRAKKKYEQLKSRHKQKCDSVTETDHGNPLFKCSGYEVMISRSKGNITLVYATDYGEIYEGD